MSKQTLEWNTYIGAKRVRAAPMTLGAYNAHRGWPMPHGEDPETHGYLVEYCNGSKPNHPDHERYISWSPEDIFEEDYHIETPRRIELMGLMSSEGTRLEPLPTHEREALVESLKDVAKTKEMSLSGSHQPRGLISGITMLDEAPFSQCSGLDAWHTFQLRLPTLARAMTLGQYRKLYNTPAQEESDLKGFAVRYPNASPTQPPSFVEEENFVRNYHLIGSAVLHIELDPNEPENNEALERIKNVSISGGLPYPLRGAKEAMAFMDEASFYPNGVPMTIYKSKPLENGMALGTVETLSGSNGNLDFSDALRALKFGYRVQRSGWNGKDMWLSVSNLNTATVPADKFWSPHNSEYAKNNGGSAEVPPCITMKNAKGQIQMGWLPSQEDCFSSDWFVFGKEDEEPTLDVAATAELSGRNPVDANGSIAQAFAEIKTDPLPGFEFKTEGNK